MSTRAGTARGGRAFSFSEAGLGVLSVLATLFAIESACRLWQWWQHALYDKAVAEMGSATAHSPPGKVELHHLVRLSRNRRIVYELVPNLAVQYPRHIPVRTNETGFRGPSHPTDKGEGTVRIVGLGDSLMFGWCVREEETFLARLGEDLGRRQPELVWETINTAVPGYNTVMEVETLQVKGLPYGPDIVILNVVGNDTDLPNFIRGKEDYLDTRRSFLWQTASSRLRGATVRVEGELAPAPRPQGRGGFEGDPDLVPEPYRDMVGLEAFRKALSRLKSMSRKHRFHVVVVSHPVVSGFARKACADLGFPALDTLPAFVDYMREHGIRKLEGSVLEISPTDRHPSPLGHRIIADVIRKHLERKGIVHKLVDRHRVRVAREARAADGKAGEYVSKARGARPR